MGKSYKSNNPYSKKFAGFRKNKKDKKHGEKQFHQTGDQSNDDRDTEAMRSGQWEQ